MADSVVRLQNRFSPRVGMSGLGIYPINKEQLRAFTNDMWTTTFSEKFIQVINGKPMDSIVALRWYYGLNSSIRRTSSYAYLTMGNVAFTGSLAEDTKIVTKPASSEFVQFDCGFLFLPRYFNNFLDYGPFTKLELYIPFVGFVTMNVNEFINRDISLVYSINLMTGASVVHVYSRQVTQMLGPDPHWDFLRHPLRMVLEMQTTIGTEIPLNIDARESISSRLATGTIGAAAIGIGLAAGPLAALGAAGAVGAAGAAAGAGAGGAVLSTIGNGVAHAIPSSGDFQRSSGLDSEASSMTFFKPFVRFTRPIPVAPADYAEQVGRPDFRSMRISQLNGYFKVASIKSAGSIVNIPRGAIDEIIQLLKGGVYSE